jgi:hypothetical protein
MLSEVAVVGLAALFVWYLLAESTLLAKPLAYPREHWPLLIGCAWCAGFWLTGLIYWGAFDYTLVGHVAAAGLTGYLGSKA